MRMTSKVDIIDFIKYNQIMPWNTKIKLEPRGDNDPKFNPNNKTDRKILLFVIVSVSILTVIAVGLFLLYYLVFR